VVPALHRVYATATGAGRVVRIDEDTGAILGRTATGAYPDGLAYDPANGTIWVTNEIRRVRNHHRRCHRRAPRDGATGRRRGQRRL